MHNLKNYTFDFIGHTILIAVLYFFTGRLGLILSIPPGFATLVWPASGLALGFFLARGKKVWLGIAIGSFLVNTVSKDWVFAYSWIAVTIALGACIQVYVTQALLRVSGLLPLTFIKSKNIVMFFVVISPLSCLVNASLGTSALYFFGKIAQSEVFVNWLTWFIGDTLGVLLFTPLVLLILQRKEDEWKGRYQYLLLSTTLSLIVFVLLFFWASARETEKIQAKSHSDASEVNLLIETRLILYERLILSVGGIFETNRDLRNEEFQNFIRITTAGLNGFTGISWVVRISGDEIPKFEEHLRSEGLHYFQLQTVTGEMVEKPLPDKVYYVLTFFSRPDLETFRGLDLGSDSRRLSAFRLAEATGRIATISDIPFFRTAQNMHGTLLVQPIHGYSQAARDERHKAEIHSFVLFGFQPAEAFADALIRTEELGLDLEVRNELGDLIIDSDPSVAMATTTDSYHIEKIMRWKVGAWDVKIRARQSYFARNRSWDTWAILTIGLTFCAAIQVFVLILTGSNYDISVQVKERTKELDDSRKNLVIARDEAIKANHAKGVFLANMSHEIRTPLNGIIGITNLFGKTKLDERQKKLHAALTVSNRGLLYLINDVLDLSKIEAGALTLDEHDFDPRPLLSEAIQTMEALAEIKGLRLISRVAGSFPGALIGDAYRLRQVILNLLSNAIKFTEQGKIEVAFSCDEAASCWFITIVDTGIGMSESILSKIFYPFAQGDESSIHASGGSGLGLAISREIVVIMGGELDVQSIVDKGSVFTVSLPLRLGNPENILRTDETDSFKSFNMPSRLVALKVLLAEDNEVNRIVAIGFLQSLDVEADVVVDGEAALKAVQAKNYDLILMDVHMPILSGTEVTKRIRKMPIKQPTIVAITADATPSEKERCLKSGMDSFLSKPLAHDALEELLKRVYAESCEASFDSDSIRAKFKDMETVLVDILEAYFESYPNNKNEIEAALSANDSSLCASVLHGLRGMISNFQSIHIIDRLFSLENCFLAEGCTHENADSIRDLLVRIDEANVTLKTLLEDLDPKRV
ncbi:MAG: response regulator [Chitinophagaceae bacterium]|nr:response regulator [Oligoflexus sp.]